LETKDTKALRKIFTIKILRALVPSWLKGFRDMKKTKQFVFNKNGSALIMTIVLTVMLAAVAVMFLAMARMDKASTSNIADNKMLDLTAMSIIEIINKELVYDTPGVAIKADVNELERPQYFEYKDYPDSNDPWLASIEPYLFDKKDTVKASTYKWHQISDITGYLAAHDFEVQDVNVKPVGLSSLYDVQDYPIFDMNEGGVFYKISGTTKTIAHNGISADADGDGIADSKWFELSDMRTTNGRVFAAVRIIDNGAMANVNTAYQFNPDDNDGNNINGVSQTRIDLENLLKSGDTITALHNARTDNQADWPGFLQNIVWDFNNFPENGYRPFDMTDELELRYRFCISGQNESRFETAVPNTSKITDKTYKAEYIYDSSTDCSLDDWENRLSEPNYILRRHLLTTYNCDRIIDPNGNKMLNINDANTTSLYNLFSKVYDSNTAAQIAVNISDYRDADSDVNVFTAPNTGKKFYGFEAPCVYISEIAYKHWQTGVVPPGEEYKSYAIELYKPYTQDDSADLSDWSLYVGATEVKIKNWSSGKYHVIRWKSASDSAPLQADSSVQVQDEDLDVDNPPFILPATLIRLERKAQNGDKIIVDMEAVPSNMIQLETHYKQRDNRKHQCIRRIWSAVINNDNTTLGSDNTFAPDDANIIPTYPANSPLTNIGEIGSIFRKSAYIYRDANGFHSIENFIGSVASLKLEENVRINLTDETLYPVFNFVTALKTPYANDSNETRVKGRININTAPARVIAQLPWVSQRIGGYDDLALAKAIVAYRDKLKEEGTSEPNYNYEGRPDANGFESTARLMKVRNLSPTYKNYSIDCYARDGNDLAGFPDLSPGTTGDEAKDDMEERDVIFARISDLVTVRSDVFTAYILVRIGTNGPQKRYIAILDRSEVKTPSDKVKIRAFQYVPDAR